MSTQRRHTVVFIICSTSLIPSFAVVMWELLTREQPYSGMDLYAVAWGVGSGKLSLPIPDASPELLKSLLEGTYVRMAMCVHVSAYMYLNVYVPWVLANMCQCSGMSTVGQ